MKDDCDKAAQILKSFVGSSYLLPSLNSELTCPLTDKNKIPREAIASARGIAIFNGIRAGAMFLAGAGGSGVVLARLPDGTWSPPSAFSVRSGSVGYVYGIDVYDCVCLLNTDAAVQAYMKTEASLGANAELSAGPASASTMGMKGER